MSSNLPLVDLMEFSGLGLVISWPTGVRFTSQTAGYACEHPEMEGVLIPLFEQAGNPASHALGQHFRGGWHALNDSDADIVDSILRRNGLGFISVDRTCMESSKEAWIHVTLTENTEGRIQGFGKARGVLTWPNSD